MFKHGTTAIHDLQTGQYKPTPLGEVKPSECDLAEHEEIVIWDEALNTWTQPDPEPSKRDKLIMSIRAFAEAILDECDELEKE